MLISELSKKTGVSIHTIRFYENKGLIEATSDKNIKTNKYKKYDESHIEKITVIKEAQEVGFTLSEIKTLLDNWYGGKSTKEEQLEFFSAKITEVNAKINQLKQARKRLEEVRKSIEKGECQE